jgi:hypothetical protein
MRMRCAFKFSGLILRSARAKRACVSKDGQGEQRRLLPSFETRALRARSSGRGRSGCAHEQGILIIALLLALAASPARAEYPEQPIRVIVPFVAGGFVDGFARIFTERLAGVLGKPVVVENKPGAGGKIGDDFVAAAPPDGYTLLIDDVTRPVLLTFGNPGAPAEDMLKTFALAGMLGTSPGVLTAAPALGVKDFAALVAKMRAEPGRHGYGSAGAGTPSHVVSAQLVRLLDLNVVHVPYRGGANAHRCRGRHRRLDGQHAQQLAAADRGRPAHAVVRDGAAPAAADAGRADPARARLSAIRRRGVLDVPDGAGCHAAAGARTAQRRRQPGAQGCGRHRAARCARALAAAG